MVRGSRQRGGARASSRSGIGTPLVAGLLLLGSIAMASGAHAQSAGWAPKVTAVYKLRMAGLELATFNFTSSVAGDAYTLAGHGKMSWGFGLFTYNGSFSAVGKVAGDTVRPATYAYDWRVNKKSGTVRLAYAAGTVSSVEIQPPSTPGPDVIPLRPNHLQNVFDPLTALIVLSRHRGTNPCGRKIGVFEGKQRFDIELSPGRDEKVAETKPSGQPAMAHVCRVKYVPVAGHKLNRETKAAINADGIEVALRPIPSANLAIPYRIVIPTPLGSAVLTAQHIEIVSPGNVLIALAH